MDFLVREGRECVDGDMYMIRFGSCGCLTELVSQTQDDSKYSRTDTTFVFRSPLDPSSSLKLV